MTKEQLEQLASLLNQDAEEVLSDLYTTDDEGNETLKEGTDLPKIIKEWSASEVRRVGESQRKRGIKEASQRWEKQLQDLAGDTGLTGDELTQALREKIETAGQTGNTPNPDELTPDKIRKLPAYKEALKEDSRRLVEERDEARKALEDTRSEYERKSKSQTLISGVFDELEKARIKWGQDPETKKARQEAIRKLVELDIEKGRIDVVDGKMVVLDKDGNPAQDKDYKDVTFSSYAHSLNTYGTEQYDRSKSSPNAKPGSKAGASDVKPGQFKITNEQEYIQAMNKYPDKKREIIDAYAQHLEAEQ